MFVLRHHGWAAVPANWFIAFPVSTEGLLERLEPPPPRVRLFAAEDLHVTLAFLGPVGEDAARRAFEHTAALGLAPFRATLGEVVALGPPRRRSALAATIADGREGLRALPDGTLALTHSTVSGNTASNGSGGGINNISGPLTLNNSIIAGNTAPTDPDIKGTISTQNGINLIGGDPQLAALGNYGGPTETMPPRCGPGRPPITGRPSCSSPDARRCASASTCASIASVPISSRMSSERSSAAAAGKL